MTDAEHAERMRRLDAEIERNRRSAEWWTAVTPFMAVAGFVLGLLVIEIIVPWLRAAAR